MKRAADDLFAPALRVCRIDIRPGRKRAYAAIDPRNCRSDRSPSARLTCLAAYHKSAKQRSFGPAMLGSSRFSGLHLARLPASDVQTRGLPIPRTPFEHRACADGTFLTPDAPYKKDGCRHAHGKRENEPCPERSTKHKHTRTEVEVSVFIHLERRHLSHKISFQLFG